MPITIQPTTLRYKNGNTFTSVDCLKGDPGDPSLLIDDTAGTGDTDKTWSADKIATEIGAGGAVSDVQINGTSILDDGVANVPKASNSSLGVVKTENNYGILVNQQNGRIYIDRASTTAVKEGTQHYRPIAPDNQHEATFYGLAKVAGHDEKDSTNTVGIYTPEAKAAIWNMLGLDGSAFVKSDWELIKEDTFTNAESAEHTITVDGNGNPFELTDVRMLLEFPNVDTPSSTQVYGQIRFYYGTNDYLTLEPGTATRTASDPAKGCWYTINYTDGMVYSEVGSWQNTSNAGSMRTRFLTYSNGTAADSGMGIIILNDFKINKILIRSTTGTAHYKLYGKRKRNGLDSPVINVSGTTPSITALPGHRYICGEVSTLSITAPASGIIDVTFDSGSTPTVLTVTPPTGMTMRWIGEDPTALEANKHYEINIADGCNGMVVSWT